GEDEQRQDDAERRPEGEGGAPGHLGVGTNRPVGRISKVSIRTTKETMIACDGLTHNEAYASIRLMKIAAAIDPTRLPMPPTTTTMKALSTQSMPMAWLTPTRGPTSTPLAAAIPEPIANTSVSRRGTGMPMAWAMRRSWVVARIQTP